MIINNKRFLLTMLVIVLPSLQLLNIHNINSKSKDKNLHQSNVKADSAKTSQTRHVAKFKSKKRDLASNNEFQNMKNKNQATNTSVFLSNKASFKYQVDYSNYNTYGAKNSGFNVAVAKNTTNRIVSIGLNLISAVTVKVSAPGQKWASLSLTNTFTPTKDMIPASIHYLIVGSKNINDAKISLNMIYEKRTDPMRPVTLKIGFFNVNNINAYVGTVLSGGAIGGIIIGCLVTAIGIAITFHAALLDLWEWKARKSATSLIDTTVALAENNEKSVAPMIFSSLKAEGSAFGNASSDSKLFEESALQPGHSSSANILGKIDETAPPASPIKQTGGSLQQKLTVQQENSEKERTTALAEKEKNYRIQQEKEKAEQDQPANILDGKDLQLANGAAETGAGEVTLPNTTALENEKTEEAILANIPGGKDLTLANVAAETDASKAILPNTTALENEKTEEAILANIPDGKDLTLANVAAEAGAGEVTLPNTTALENEKAEEDILANGTAETGAGEVTLANTTALENEKTEEAIHANILVGKDLPLANVAAEIGASENEKTEEAILANIPGGKDLTLANVAAETDASKAILPNTTALENEKTEEEAIPAKTLDGNNLPPANGTAETGASEAILPKDEQGANVLGDIGGATSQTEGKSYFHINKETKKVLRSLRWEEDQVDFNRMELAETTRFFDTFGIDLEKTPVFREELKGKCAFFVRNADIEEFDSSDSESD